MILLASNSVTRAKILTNNKIDFISRGSSFNEERLTYRDPYKFVFYSAKGKMAASQREFGLDLPLLCADSVVFAKNKILRKAKSRADARVLLNMQSNSSVKIISCLIYKTRNMELIDISTTSYLFDEFNQEDLMLYLKTEEWIGKAGACMVEGFCKKYIKHQIGSTNCAMGLQIEKLIPFL